MAEITDKGWQRQRQRLGMTGDDWKWLEMTRMAGNSLKWITISEISLNCWKYREGLELLDIAENGLNFVPAQI